MSVFVGIPTYNARSTIAEVIKGIEDLGFVDQIIVVLDGCTDGTRDFVPDKSHIRIVDHVKNKGYGGAQKTIFRTFLEMSGSDDDILIHVHSDGQTPAFEVPLFLEEFNRQPELDLVLGSRVLGRKTSAFQRKLWRQAGDFAMTLLANTLMGARFSTYASGFRAFKAKGLKKINFENYTDMHFIDVEILFDTIRAGLKFVEIPVGVYPPQNQKTGIPGLRGEFKAFFFYITKYAFQFLSLSWKYKKKNG